MTDPTSESQRCECTRNATTPGNRHCDRVAAYVVVRDDGAVEKVCGVCTMSGDQSRVALPTTSGPGPLPTQSELEEAAALNRDIDPDDQLDLDEFTAMVLRRERGRHEAEVADLRQRNADCTVFEMVGKDGGVLGQAVVFSDGITVMHWYEGPMTFVLPNADDMGFGPKGTWSLRLVHGTWTRRDKKTRSLEELRRDGFVGSGTVHALQRAGVTSVEHLCEHTPSQLLRIKGLGSVGLRHIRDTLREWGMHLRDDSRKAYQP